MPCSRAGGVGAAPRIERFLDQPLWRDALAEVERWPQDTLRGRQRYERARWVLQLLYATVLRASEAAQAHEGDLPHVRGRWWLRVIGKGNVEGRIPLSDSLIQDYARYRAFLGLSVQPDTASRRPLICGIAGHAQPLTSTAVYLIVKDVFRRVATAWEADQPERTAQLRRASAHWLRHTAASHQADDGMPPHHTQQYLRHSSIATASIYLHVEDDARHVRTTASNPKPNDSPPKTPHLHGSGLETA